VCNKAVRVLRPINSSRHHCGKVEHDIRNRGALGHLTGILEALLNAECRLASPN